MRLLIPLALFMTLVSGPLLAATLRAQVASDADVYAQPNFSSRKIEHLEQGMVVYMKTDKFIGTGGMGVFFKIKTPSGKVGYITDGDLLAPTSEGMKPIPVPASQSATPETPPAPKKEGSGTLWGLSVGLVDYSEKIQSKTWSKQHIFFGARRTGAATSLYGWRTDVGMIMSPGAPKFLADAGAYGETSGFILLGDFLFLKPLWASPKFMISGAAGPLIGYSSYTTNFATGPHSANEFKLGAVVDLGIALNFSGNALRFDVKYFIEKTSYLSEMVTLQMGF